MNFKGVTLDLVFWFVERGFSVIPVYLRSKQPRIKWGKYQKQLPTHGELIRWFRVPSNGAVVTGTNNLVVIDFDTISDYVQWSLWAVDGPQPARIILRDAYKVRTSRGVHVYTRVSSKMRNMHFGNIDIKAWGGLVTLPGSIHPSGAIYTEYGGDSFPVWSDLTDVFPSWMVMEEKVKIVGRKEVESRDLSELDQATILNMPAAIDLGELKRKYRIEDMIEGIVFTGDHWGVAKCPFHDDANPSFWVDTKRQLCGCFSGCTAQPLDVINLYARLNHLSNSDAIRELGAR